MIAANSKYIGNRLFLSFLISLFSDMNRDPINKGATDLDLRGPPSSRRADAGCWSSCRDRRPESGRLSASRPDPACSSRRVREEVVRCAWTRTSLPTAQRSQRRDMLCNSRKDYRHKLRNQLITFWLEKIIGTSVLLWKWENVQIDCIFFLVDIIANELTHPFNLAHWDCYTQKAITLLLIWRDRGYGIMRTCYVAKWQRYLDICQYYLQLDLSKNSCTELQNSLILPKTVLLRWDRTQIIRKRIRVCWRPI